MGLKESVTWDWDSSTWGGRGECIGTVPLMIRVNLGRPMRLKESVTWDWDSSTWGDWGECIGTVSVSASVRE
nr:hypothetical protein [Tanacetum cinerariifolium]